MIQAKKQKTETKEKKPSVDKDQRTDKLFQMQDCVHYCCVTWLLASLITILVCSNQCCSCLQQPLSAYPFCRSPTIAVVVPQRTVITLLGPPDVLAFSVCAHACSDNFFVHNELWNYSWSCGWGNSSCGLDKWFCGWNQMVLWLGQVVLWLEP